MNTKRFFQFVIIAVTALSMTSCEEFTKKALKVAMEKAKENVASFEYVDSEKWGKVVSREVEVGTITSVTTLGATQVVFTQDSASTLRLYGNEKAIDAYEVKVDNGELLVRMKNGKTSVNHDTPRMTLYVSGPYLDDLTLEGACDVELEGCLVQKQPLSVNISGVGEFEADSIRCESFEIRISGAGDADLDKLVCDGDVRIDVQGAGDIEGDVDCNDLKLGVSGAGNVSLNVKCEYLRSSVQGAGNIKLSGECYKFSGSNSKASNIDTSELEVKDR